MYLLPFRSRRDGIPEEETVVSLADKARVKAQELRGRIKRNTACRYGMNALGSAGAPGHGLNQGPTGSACS